MYGFIDVGKTIMIGGILAIVTLIILDENRWQEIKKDGNCVHIGKDSSSSSAKSWRKSVYPCDNNVIRVH